MSIFTRLFLAFWAAVIISIAASFLLFAPKDPPSKRLWETMARGAVIPVAESMVDDIERGDRTAASALQSRLSENGNATIAIFDADGNSVLSGTLPPELEVQSFLHSSETVRNLSEDRTVGKSTFTSASGKRYTLVALLRDFMRPEPKGELARFAILVFVSGLICYGVARYLTTPLVVLRNTAKKLAAGDLSARASSARSVGRDEISSLVRDFNDMAARIQLLVGAERRLTSDISHELRSPLARLGVALGIARNKSTPELQGSLDRIELEAERLNALVGEILRLASLESSAERLQFTNFDLGVLTEKIAEDANFEGRQKSTQVLFETAGETPCINGDRELVHRAVENVVRNAVHYTPNGTNVEVGLSSSPASIVLTVRDQGPGVPKEELRKILQPFYRVGDDRGRNTGGHGLGLAISAHAIELHGGSIEATNAVSSGLLVTIHLPR